MSGTDPKFDYDVFISYSSRDKDWVRGDLLKWLEANGLRVCIDYRDFRPGAPSVKEMERAIVTSHKTLLVLTPNYLASAWTEFENLMLQTLDPANRNLRLIPLLKEKCDLPSRIGFLTYVDFVDPDDWDLAWTRLLNSLRPESSVPSSASAIPATIIPPAPRVQTPPLPPLELSVRFFASDEKAPVSVALFRPDNGASSNSMMYNSPLDEKQLGDLRWYLEDFTRWPSGPDYDRAENIRHSLSRFKFTLTVVPN